MNRPERRGHIDISGPLTQLDAHVAASAARLDAVARDYQRALARAYRGVKRPFSVWKRDQAVLAAADAALSAASKRHAVLRRRQIEAWYRRSSNDIAALVW